MKFALTPRRLLESKCLWILALAALTFGTPFVAAQTATGRISGTVLDPTGAAVQDALITIRSESSGATFSAVTSSAGGFTAIDLPAGIHAVEVEVPGFRRHVVQNIKVDVATEASLPPIRLEIGEITSVVEVEGGVSQVQTTTAELTSTVTSGQIADLPLINRDPLGLIHLQAGVVSAGRASTAINGQRTSFSNVTLDGINIQDNYIRGNGLDFLPSRTLLGQVAEITITTQNANAAVGGGSSHVSFTTPSGGTEYHGGLYWHNRNSALTAAEWFSNRQGLPPDSGEPEPFLGQVFFHPDPGEAGTLQRRMFSGPSALALDFAVNKTTRLTESQSVRFGASFSNFLNHPTFLSGDHFLDETQFGRVTSTLTGARVIELHLRYSF